MDNVLSVDSRSVSNERKRERDGGGRFVDGGGGDEDMEGAKEQKKRKQEQIGIGVTYAWYPLAFSCTATFLFCLGCVPLMHARHSILPCFVFGRDSCI